MADLIVFPAHALLIVEERLREQEAERLEMEGMERDQLALRILIASEIAQRRKARRVSPPPEAHRDVTRLSSS